MPYTHRDATEADLPRIVEIYNHAVATRTCSCDLEPTTVQARLAPFRARTADLAIYLHPDYQARGLGTYLIGQAIAQAPRLGIETLTATIFASNTGSLRLFARMGFERWGFMPRVARLEGVEKDLVLVGRRLCEPDALPAAARAA
ncbi:MAG: N-acetyltransferase [Rhodoferax sp.]|nr:N-acetyltransferase [Rhodoferax sp.]